MRFPKEEYHLPFFDEYGYLRKLCPRCGEYWTQNTDQKLCGESTVERYADYTFIGRHPTQKSFSIPRMRETSISFFENKIREKIKPYLIVARWQDDLHLDS